MQEKPKDPEKRKSLKKIVFSLPLLFFPNLFLSSTSYSIKVFNWKKYKIPSEKYLKKILKEGYPKILNLDYIIPENECSYGKIQGFLKLRKNLSSIILDAEIFQKFENKYWKFSEEIVRESKKYFEKEVDLDFNPPKINYNSCYNLPRKTMFNLIDNFLLAKSGNDEISFFGEDKKEEKYLIKTKKRNLKNYDLEIFGETAKGKSKIQDFTIFFQKVKSTYIPVEISLNYKVSIFGGIPIEIRAVLTEK